MRGVVTVLMVLKSNVTVLSWADEGRAAEGPDVEVGNVD